MSKPTLNLIESLFANVKGYVEDRLELFKLKLVDKVSSIVSSVLSGLVLFLFFIIFFIVFNIGIALLVGDLLGKFYLGFLIVAAFYALAGLVLFIGRNFFFKAVISGMIIKKFYKNASKKNS